MNIRARIRTAAVGLFGLCGLNSAALAFSTTAPGERAGLDLASPAPEGVYFGDTASVGTWRDGPKNGDSTVAYNVPVVVWATPWTIADGRVSFWVAAPQALAGFNHFDGAPGGPAAHGVFVQGMYNPFIAAQTAWSLGNGFAVSTMIGAYLPIAGGDFGNLLNVATIHEMLALSYHGGGWNVTANLYAGQRLDSGSCTAIPFTTTCSNNDWFNYDLAVTHSFGRWELGAVGFGSTDFNVPGLPNFRTLDGQIYPGAQAQFALGGLVGYNFGPLIMKLVVATDVYIQNYNAYETQGILHVIVPVWRPESPTAVAAKY